MEWEWGADKNTAFRRLKQVLSADTLLMPYSMDLPVSLACDASDFGVGAVLFHRMPPDAQWEPAANRLCFQDAHCH